jgi:hypothetical protein
MDDAHGKDEEPGDDSANADNDMMHDGGGTNQMMGQDHTQKNNSNSGGSFSGEHPPNHQATITFGSFPTPTQILASDGSALIVSQSTNCSSSSMVLSSGDDAPQIGKDFDAYDANRDFPLVKNLCAHTDVLSGLPDMVSDGIPFTDAHSVPALGLQGVSG